MESSFETRERYKNGIQWWPLIYLILFFADYTCETPNGHPPFDSSTMSLYRVNGDGYFGTRPPGFSNPSSPVTQLGPTRKIMSDLPRMSLLRVAFRNATGHRFRFMRLQPLWRRCGCQLRSGKRSDTIYTHVLCSNERIIDHFIEKHWRWSTLLRVRFQSSMLGSKRVLDYQILQLIPRFDVHHKKKHGTQTWRSFPKGISFSIGIYIVSVFMLNLRNIPLGPFFWWPCVRRFFDLDTYRICIEV